MGHPSLRELISDNVGPIVSFENWQNNPKYIINSYPLIFLNVVAFQKRKSQTFMLKVLADIAFMLWAEPTN